MVIAGYLSNTETVASVIIEVLFEPFLSAQPTCPYGESSTKEQRYLVFPNVTKERKLILNTFELIHGMTYELEIPSTENMPPRYTALQIEQSDRGRRCSRWISMWRVAPSNASCCDVRRGYSWLPALYHGCLHTGQTASRCPLLSSIGIASCCKSWLKRTA